jgi:aerobic carbon-monoxide dehydrogenase large subunit
MSTPKVRLTIKGTILVTLAAAQLLGRPGDISFEGDLACLGGDTEKSVSLPDIAHVADFGKHGITLPKGHQGRDRHVELPRARTRRVRDRRARRARRGRPETGGVTILRYVIGHGCGNVIDPPLVNGQVLGGFAHGIGNARYEEPVYDVEARPQAASHLDHALVPATEVPEAELFPIHTPSPLNPLGVKGTGEGGTTPAPAAIANAVEDALRPPAGA